LVVVVKYCLPVIQTVDSFSSESNFISVTPGGIQRHNGRGMQVVRTYWPTG